jgi:hypothetical protein
MQLIRRRRIYLTALVVNWIHPELAIQNDPFIIVLPGPSRWQ